MEMEKSNVPSKIELIIVLLLGDSEKKVRKNLFFESNFHLLIFCFQLLLVFFNFHLQIGICRLQFARNDENLLEFHYKQLKTNKLTFEFADKVL